MQKSTIIYRAICFSLIAISASSHTSAKADLPNEIKQKIVAQSNDLKFEDVKAKSIAGSKSFDLWLVSFIEAGQPKSNSLQRLFFLPHASQVVSRIPENFFQFEVLRKFHVPTTKAVRIAFSYKSCTECESSTMLSAVEIAPDGSSIQFVSDSMGKNIKLNIGNDPIHTPDGDLLRSCSTQVSSHGIIELSCTQTSGQGRKTTHTTQKFDLGSERPIVMEPETKN